MEKRKTFKLWNSPRQSSKELCQALGKAEVQETCRFIKISLHCQGSQTFKKHRSSVFTLHYIQQAFPVRHQPQKGAQPKQKSQILKRLRVQPKFCFQHCKPEVQKWWRCLSAHEIGFRQDENTRYEKSRVQCLSIFCSGNVWNVGTEIDWDLFNSNRTTKTRRTNKSTSRSEKG